MIEANTTAECFTAIYGQQPFSLNVWYNQVLYFPLIGAGYYSQYDGIFATMVVISVVTLTISIWGLILKTLQQKDIFCSLVLIWQFYIALSILLSITTFYSTATASTQLVHMFLEIVLITVLCIRLRTPTANLNQPLWILVLVLGAYFQLFHSTSTLYIQQILTVWSVLTDSIHPIVSGIFAKRMGGKLAWTHFILTIIHWLSFYPTVPFCWNSYATGIYVDVFIGVNLIPLVYFTL